VIGYGPTGLTAASLLGNLDTASLLSSDGQRCTAYRGSPILTARRRGLLSFVCDIGAKGRRLTDVADIPGLQMGYPAHISIYQPDIEAPKKAAKACARRRPRSRFTLAAPKAR
jgi:3-(3-hydroxy-phenyl)propionate hydroxylase